MTVVKNYSAQLFKSIAILMLVAFSFSSCKKDKDDVKAPATPANLSIEGTYLGKYGFGNDTPDTDQKYSIKTGGVFQEIGLNSGIVVGQGTWQLNGTTFTASYTVTFSPFNKYSVSAVFNPSNGKLIGTWGGELDPTDGGKIDMKKQ